MLDVDVNEVRRILNIKNEKVYGQIVISQFYRLS